MDGLCENAVQLALSVVFVLKVVQTGLEPILFLSIMTTSIAFTLLLCRTVRSWWFSCAVTANHNVPMIQVSSERYPVGQGVESEAASELQEGAEGAEGEPVVRPILQQSSAPDMEEEMLPLVSMSTRNAGLKSSHPRKAVV